MTVIGCSSIYPFSHSAVIRTQCTMGWQGPTLVPHAIISPLHNWPPHDTLMTLLLSYKVMMLSGQNGKGRQQLVLNYCKRRVMLQHFSRCTEPWESTGQDHCHHMLAYLLQCHHCHPQCHHSHLWTCIIVKLLQLTHCKDHSLTRCSLLCLVVLPCHPAILHPFFLCLTSPTLH